MITKLTFSPEELSAVKNTDFFQRKKNITQSVYDYYASLNEAYKNVISEHGFILLKEVISNNGKITRGENYEGLPYIILDFPAFFAAKNIFAVRSFFWWGNGFSQHFLISHFFYKKYVKKIEAAEMLLARNKFSICISEKPWIHHFRKENYVRISSLREGAFSQIIHQNEFIKIGADYSFDTRNLMERQKKDFTTLMQITLT